MTPKVIIYLGKGVNGAKTEIGSSILYSFSILAHYLLSLKKVHKNHNIVKYSVMSENNKSSH